MKRRRERRGGGLWGSCDRCGDDVVLLCCGVSCAVPKNIMALWCISQGWATSLIALTTITPSCIDAHISCVVTCHVQAAKSNLLQDIEQMQRQSTSEIENLEAMVDSLREEKDVSGEEHSIALCSGLHSPFCSYQMIRK